MKRKPKPARRGHAAPAPRREAASPPAAAAQNVRLDFGEPAPFFTAVSDVNPTFRFEAVAGRWTVLAFMGPLGGPASLGARGVLNAERALFDSVQAALFMVVDQEPGTLKSDVGYRYFFDSDQLIARRYGVFDGDIYRPTVFLLDHALRVLTIQPLEQMAKVLALMKQVIAEDAAAPAPPAPVLLVPRIFEPELCQALIDLHARTGGAASGFMREVNGQTVVMHDVSHKRRKDVLIDDEDLKVAVRRRVEKRLLPMIERAFGWRATKLERYLIARYADEDLGFFNAHRDNTTAGTAHRKFAVSINLNADYDGGELRFPEFGRALYKPTIGGACVFNCSLLHEARPVTRGERYVFVPFLYDDDGERVRQANLHKVRLEPPAKA